jgi:hypothetical protein
MALGMAIGLPSAFGGDQEPAPPAERAPRDLTNVKEYAHA